LGASGSSAGNSSPSDTTPPPPVATRVTSPNGGETWLANIQDNVTWIHGLATDQLFDVDFSSNGGSTWSSLVRGVRPNVLNASTQEYALQARMPATPTSNALIRVSPSGNAAAGDVSDKPFTLVQPTVTLTAPTATSAWGIG